MNVSESPTRWATKFSSNLLSSKEARGIFARSSLKSTVLQVPDRLWDPIKEPLSLRNALAHHNGEVSLPTKVQVSTFGKISGVDVGSSEILTQVSYIDGQQRL